LAFPGRSRSSGAWWRPVLRVSLRQLGPAAFPVARVPGAHGLRWPHGGTGVCHEGRAGLGRRGLEVGAGGWGWGVGRRGRVGGGRRADRIKGLEPERARARRMPSHQRPPSGRHPAPQTRTPQRAPRASSPQAPPPRDAARPPPHKPACRDQEMAHRRARDHQSPAEEARRSPGPAQAPRRRCPGPTSFEGLGRRPPHLPLTHLLLPHPSPLPPTYSLPPFPLLPPHLHADPESFPTGRPELPQRVQLPKVAFPGGKVVPARPLAQTPSVP
jgi:hypothetical protein